LTRSCLEQPDSRANACSRSLFLRVKGEAETVQVQVWCSRQFACLGSAKKTVPASKVRSRLSATTFRRRYAAAGRSRDKLRKVAESCGGAGVEVRILFDQLLPPI